MNDMNFYEPSKKLRLDVYWIYHTKSSKTLRVTEPLILLRRNLVLSWVQWIYQLLWPQAESSNSQGRSQKVGRISSRVDELCIRLAVACQCSPPHPTILFLSLFFGGFAINQWYHSYHSWFVIISIEELVPLMVPHGNVRLFHWGARSYLRIVSMIS